MTTFKHESLVVLVAAGLLFAPLHASGDVAPLQQVKGGFVAIQSPHQNIRLDSERVIIRLKRESYVVDALFDLFNTGETITEWIGFPRSRFSREFPLWKIAEFIKFGGTVNGKEIPFSEEMDPLDVARLSRRRRPPPSSFPLISERPHWFVSEVTFPGQATTVIHITYEAAYYYRPDGRVASYIYGTGSLWKGRIRKAVFIVDRTEAGDKCDIALAFVQGCRPQRNPDQGNSLPTQTGKNTVKYEVRGFKPYPEAHIGIVLGGRLHTSHEFVWRGTQKPSAPSQTPSCAEIPIGK